MKKVGIYGGTFDPIHHGHLILAREAQEALGLMKVLFVLAAQSPHKRGETATPSAVRWQMLQAAIEDEPGFVASRIELDRPQPSYTCETVEQLHQENPGTQFYFLLGEDNLPLLHTWHRFEDLQKLVQFIVLDRSGIETAQSYPIVRRKVDISATTIRNRVATGRSIRYLVPEAVEQIIRQKKLYQGAN